MPNTTMIAKIKKIDITNKVTSDNWSQMITITLSDIELNDENLIAIRKFRPNEEVQVNLRTLQLTMDEMAAREKLRQAYPTCGEVEGACPPETQKYPVEKISLSTGRQEEEPMELIDEAVEEEEEEQLFHLDYDESPPHPSTILKVFDFSFHPQ